MAFLNNLIRQQRLRRKRRSSAKNRLKLARLVFEPLEERQMLTTVYWDPTQSGGTNLGGSGDWTGTDNWWDGSNDVSWTSGDDAVFDVSGSSAAGTVTIDSGISADSTEFQAAGYTLSGGALTLTGSGSVITANASATINSAVVIGTGQQWDIAASQTLSVTGVISGTGTLATTDTGTLTLSNSSNYTGGTAIQDGTLELGTSNALPTNTVVTFGTTSTNGVLELNGFNQEVGGLAVASGTTAQASSLATAAAPVIQLSPTTIRRDRPHRSAARSKTL